MTWFGLLRLGIIGKAAFIYRTGSTIHKSFHNTKANNQKQDVFACWGSWSLQLFNIHEGWGRGWILTPEKRFKPTMELHQFWNRFRPMEQIIPSHHQHQHEPMPRTASPNRKSLEHIGLVRILFVAYMYVTPMICCSLRTRKQVFEWIFELQTVAWGLSSWKHKSRHLLKIMQIWNLHKSPLLENMKPIYKLCAIFSLVIHSPLEILCGP